MMTFFCLIRCHDVKKEKKATKHTLTYMRAHRLKARTQTHAIPSHYSDLIVRDVHAHKSLCSHLCVHWLAHITSDGKEY